MKKKVLFMIHDLGQGGAEKVLVNLVNNMDRNRFDITVLSVFGGGVNEQFLRKDICYKTVFKKMIKGNSHLMKLLTPGQLHNLFVKDTYDIEVSYLEGPTARIVSGCSDVHTKKVSWIHVEQHTMKSLSGPFRSVKEAARCYESFDRTICVSEYVKKDFSSILNFNKPIQVLYNTVESSRIRELAKFEQFNFPEDHKTHLIAVGTLKETKGYMRLLRIIRKLADDYPICLYILGIGPLEKEMKQYIEKNGLEQNVKLLGYQTNPYKYVLSSDLFVCASFAEGFSTAVTESLILGTPVCTVEVSGMHELLGNNNEYGIVTKNDEESLYKGIKSLLDDPELLHHYAEMAEERGKSFETEATVKAVEDMLLEVCRGS